MQELVDAGMDVARLNMSHGIREDLTAAIGDVRQASATSERSVAILADLQGPKIRLGVFGDGPVELTNGQEFVITTEKICGDANSCSTTYEGLPGDVHVGDLLLIDDGSLMLRATRVTATTVITEVVEGGLVSDHKGINLPGVAVSVPALSDKDVDDLRWALRAGVDLIALSFVRTADDVRKVHAIMDEVGIRLPVLAKIEKPQAVDNLPQIIDAFDGVMVARGDLGVELPMEQVPLVQKRAISMCREAGKPVIVATQMLESMITARRPTRAEASDVANAVLDGTDALMLSAETSVGAHPTVVVKTMARIIQYVEEQTLTEATSMLFDEGDSTSRALASAACQVGAAVGATQLCTYTLTGLSARLLARHRQTIPLYAFTPDPKVRAQLSLVWGVETFVSKITTSTDDMVRMIDHELLRLQRCERGDHVVITASVPPGVPGKTNGMRVHTVGHWNQPDSGVPDGP
jgi:pyruvate kinase